MKALILMLAVSTTGFQLPNDKPFEIEEITPQGPDRGIEIKEIYIPKPPPIPLPEEEKPFDLERDIFDN